MLGAVISILEAVIRNVEAGLFFLVMTVRVPKASAKPTGSASCFWKEKFRRFGWPLPPGPRLTVLVGWGIALFCGAEKKSWRFVW